MTPMTSAEKETSQRTCEILGTTVGGLLTWGFWGVSASYVAATDRANHEISLPNLLANLIFTFLLMGWAYGGAFWLLDVWWRRVSAKHGREARPNWAIIPFLASWVAWSGIFLCFRPASSDGNLFNNESMAVVGWGLGWSVVMWFIACFFWFLGFIVRLIRS